ncbi:MAG: MEDS domain-containing protein [Thermodesulfovibrionales bacterium]
MDKLLNIKEASEFLKVSEMTIRRWTNSGRLKCFRVGGKRERRFRISDLQELLQTDREEISLGFRGEKVPNEAHISHFYTSSEESFALGIPYIKEGIDRGELILCVLPEEKKQRFCSGLEEQGVLLNVLEQQGIFTAITGRASLDAQAEAIRSLLEKSQLFKGFRLLGDMVWTFEQSWDFSQLYALEKMTNEIRVGKNSLFLCQYDTTRFSADIAFMAMQTHNYTVYKDHVRSSPYFDIAKGWVPAASS